MKHPLHKIGKKNRNVISGILVAFASIYAVASYFNVPQDELNVFFMSVALLVFGIMLLAITTVAIIKGVGKLRDLFMGQSKNK